MFTNTRTHQLCHAGESDISVSMVDAESRIRLKYIGDEPTDREVAEVIIRILKEEGVEVEG